jgi:hypothetical protein
MASNDPGTSFTCLELRFRIYVLTHRLRRPQNLHESPIEEEQINASYTDGHLLATLDPRLAIHPARAK